MKRTPHLIPDYIKWFIVSRDQEGYKAEDIVSTVQDQFHRPVCERSITRILDRFDQTGDVSNAWSGGRPKLFNKQENKKIVKAVRRNKTLTGVDVSRNPNLNIHGASTRTVQRLLNDNGLISSSDVPQYLRPDQKEDRVAFCEKYKEMPKQFWQNALFADESDLAPVKSGKLRVRRYVGEEVEVDVGPVGKWDSRTIKAFGVISKNGVGPLVPYEEHMDANKYIGILQNNLIPAYNSIRGTRTRESKLTYFHDQASSHTAKLTEKWFTQTRVSGVYLPPKSYDLNPIENCWSLLKDELFKKNRYLNSREDVWREAQKIWYGKVNDYVPKLYDTIPERLERVYNNNGIHTKK